MRLLIIGTLNGQIGAASQIAMRRGAKVQQVNDEEAALEALRSGRGADLILADVSLDMAKLINALEADSELTPANVQKFSLIHPRCGTAFLLWVMVIGIFVFALVGRPVWYWLIVSRIALLPVIAGLAYELIRYAGKHQGNRVLMTLLAPGLWLQRLTTREPTLDQVEVSIRALEEVVRRERSESAEELRAESRVEVMA